ncbi:glycosyltransferase family 9 protein [Leptolyngbya sp. NIES-2104]|uniref:glycosyltransferase family 9 protein n=1 Tax=Leptolyngbya sp. NIES-2104 TaxID=1552121 RepID=UPI0006EC4B7B|nr:glycosyltransferase family 9 protein [Leptolyngbya sp. NIES-2104]GAP94729.1 ADP-heptose--lipooligosaccharide heptosyltransferase II [Leptolyngbya sp. NIES-2104]
MQRILFIELLGGIGDILIALSAIQALARSHQTKVTVLTFAPGGSLLETDPLVDRVVYAEKGTVRQSIEQLLTQQSFDLIVSDTNYDRIDELIRDRADRVVTNLWRSPPPNQLVSDRFVEILQSEGLISESLPPKIYLTSEEYQAAREKLAGLARPIVVLCPDAGMQIKRWDERNFIKVGQELKTSIVVLVGSDREQSAFIADNIPAAKLWELGTIRELAAMLSQADLMIAGDTGAARIAAAVGTPTITLFGPSWSERYGQPQPHVNLQGYLNCPERRIENFTVQACWYGGDCPIADWVTCVDEISVDRVMAAARELLEAQNVRK